jgi:redox-sensitive bicupin YhaK (pirin superfamily)
MAFKTVKYLLPSTQIYMDGFPVKQALPTQKVEQVDPYLLIHHARVKPLFDRPAKIQGVGPHPHRGFSPVTFVLEGEVHHRDSRGNNQIAEAGDVQWLNAGAGIIHSERPSQGLIDKCGRQEIIQIWINTPAAFKMKEPQYQYLAEEKMPVIKSLDGAIENKLVAGAYEGQKGKIKSQSELLILWAKSVSAGEMTYEIPDGYSACVYLMKGNFTITGYGKVDAENLVVFSDEGNGLSLKVEKDTQYLVLCGKPLNEKKVQQGPFVMNTETEILEAMRDYRMGKMGVLIEE